MQAGILSFNSKLHMLDDLLDERKRVVEVEAANFGGLDRLGDEVTVDVSQMQHLCTDLKSLFMQLDGAKELERETMDQEGMHVDIQNIRKTAGHLRDNITRAIIKKGESRAKVRRSMLEKILDSAKFLYDESLTQEKRTLDVVKKTSVGGLRTRQKMDKMYANNKGKHDKEEL